MGYNLNDITEIARTYGEISVFQALIDQGIEKRENAEKCLTAIGNYKRTVPLEVRKKLGIRVNDLERTCNEILTRGL